MNNLDKLVELILPYTGDCDECDRIGDACLDCIHEAKDAAQNIADAGLLMPDLPEPSSVEDEDGEKRVSWTTLDYDIELEPGEMIVIGLTQAGYGIEIARPMGLALLAASTYKKEK